MIVREESADAVARNEAGAQRWAGLDDFRQEPHHVNDCLASEASTMGRSGSSAKKCSSARFTSVYVDVGKTGGDIMADSGCHQLQLRPLAALCGARIG